MNRPIDCAGCGGKGPFKKAHREAPLRDGSRYWKCKKCGHGVEVTAEGYVLADPLPNVASPAPTTLPSTPANRERLIIEDLVSRAAIRPPSELQRELAQKAVKSQEEFKRRLNSPDPKIRAAAESEARRAALNFLMDTSFGGP